MTVEIPDELASDLSEVLMYEYITGSEWTSNGQTMSDVAKLIDEQL